MIALSEPKKYWLQKYLWNSGEKWNGVLFSEVFSRIIIAFEFSVSEMKCKGFKWNLRAFVSLKRSPNLMNDIFRFSRIQFSLFIRFFNIQMQIQSKYMFTFFQWFLIFLIFLFRFSRRAMKMYLKSVSALRIKSNSKCLMVCHYLNAEQRPSGEP